MRVLSLGITAPSPSWASTCPQEATTRGLSVEEALLTQGAAILKDIRRQEEKGVKKIQKRPMTPEILVKWTTVSNHLSVLLYTQNK